MSGEVAVKVFSGAKLAGSVLGEIWNIADEENNGWLSKTGTAKALRLIGHAQKGSKVSHILLTKCEFHISLQPTLLTLVCEASPLAVIDGYASIPQQNTGASTPKSPPGFPPLSPQDKIKFQNIFNRSGPANGLLNGMFHFSPSLLRDSPAAGSIGEKARDIFLKSQLSNDKLLQVWQVHFSLLKPASE